MLIIIIIICGKFEQSIDHIVSVCLVLAKKEYIYRHNKTAAYIHRKICRGYEIEANEHEWHEKQPKPVTENSEVTILWDMPVLTYREIKASRPGIVVKDKKERGCMLIDLAVSSESNTSAKFTEKLSNYKDWEIEVNRMWDMKTETIPVVVKVLRLIKKGLDKVTSSTNEIQ